MLISLFFTQDYNKKSQTLKNSYKVYKQLLVIYVFELSGDSWHKKKIPLRTSQTSRQ